MTYLFQNGLLRRQGAVIEAAHSITADGLAPFQLDLDDGSYQVIVIDAGVTSIEISGFTGTAWQVGMGLRIEVVQPSAGNCAVTWPSDIVWDQGGAPFLSTAGDSMDSFEFNVSVLGAGKQMVGSMTGSFTAPVGGGGGGGAFSNTDCASFGGGHLQAATSGIHDFDGSSGFSISLWVKPASVTASNQWFVSKIDAGSYYKGFQLYTNSAGTKINFDFLVSYVSARLEYETTGMPLVAGIWNHLTLVYTNTSTAALYCNGVIAASTRLTSTLSGSISNAGRFQISDRNAAGGLWYDGKMDEVSVWSKALTASEVETLYNASQPTDLTGETDLDAWYRFKSTDDFGGTADGIDDELGTGKLTASGSVVSASDPASGLSHWWKLDDDAMMPADSGFSMGMLVGELSDGTGPTLVSGGTAPNSTKDSVAFDGVGVPEDRFTTSLNSSYVSQTISFSMWIKTATLASGDTFFNGAANSGNGPGGFRLYNTGANYLKFMVGSSANEVTFYPLPASAWTHIVAVCDYPNNTAILYVDKTASSAISTGVNPENDYAGSTAWISAGATSFALGNSWGAGYYSGFGMNGEMSDFRIYDRALTQADADAIYDAGMGQW